MKAENQKESHDIRHIQREVFSDSEKIKKDRDNREYDNRIKRNQ